MSEMICIKQSDGLIYARFANEPAPAEEPQGTPYDPEIRKAIEEWFVTTTFSSHSNQSI